MRVGVVIAVLVVTVSACTVGPDYERPDIQTMQGFREQIDGGQSIANVEWWQIFGDDVLEELVLIALEENRDLNIAAARIEEARARLGFVRADQLPSVDVRVNGNRGNSLEQIIPGTGVVNNYLVSANVFYEIDLFGKLRRSTESARAELLATEEAYRTVLISLIGNVAATYFLMRDLDDRYEIAARTLSTRQDSTRIIRERFNQGIVPILDVNQAEVQEAEAAADLALYERQVVQAENLLSVLLGRNPGPITRGEELTEQTFPPNVPAGLPSELLDRRPDVRAAEQLLAAQTARIGIAEALKYPSLSLTAFGGYASNDLSGMNDNESSIWDIGIGLFAPLYSGGRNRRRVDVEVARTEQLLNRYELTILQAFREVEDALVAVRTLGDESAAREMQTRAAQSAATLSRARYDGGVTSFLEVLDSERSLFNAEIALSSTRRARLVSIVTLYKALGGGWTPPESN